MNAPVELVKQLEAANSTYRVWEQISGATPGHRCALEDKASGKRWHEAGGSSPEDAMNNALATADFSKCPATVGDAITIISGKDAEIARLSAELDALKSQSTTAASTAVATDGAAADAKIKSPGKIKLP